MKTAAKEEVHGAPNMPANKGAEFYARPSDVETAATSWSIADMDSIVRRLETEIYSITSNEQMEFKKELSILLTKFEAW